MEKPEEIAALVADWETNDTQERNDGPECPAEFVRTDGSKIDYTVVKKIANPKSKNFGKEYTEQSEQNARYQRMLERVAKKQAEKDKIAAGNALAAGDD